VEFGLANQNLSRYGGAATFGIGEYKGTDGSRNQNIRVLINPDEVDNTAYFFCCSALGQTRFGGQGANPPWDIRNLTTGITMWHEFGHAWSAMHGDPGHVGPETYDEAHAWENRMRQQVYGPLGPNNAPRKIE
jgi:hypothetical protein